MKMVLQLSVRDIGQLTDFERWLRSNLTRDNSGVVHFRDAAGMRHDPAMAP
jgi:hypothetical protein